MKRAREAPVAQPRQQLRWAEAAGTQALERARRRDAAKRARVRVKPAWAYLDEEERAAEARSGRALMDAYDGAFRYFFEHSEMRLGYMQEKAKNVITVALLGKFFKHDLVANLRALRKKYVIKQLNDTVAISFPRRSGKTELAALLCAVLVVSQPKANCVMYTLMATHAKEFINSVIVYLKVCLSLSHSPSLFCTDARADFRPGERVRLERGAPRSEPVHRDPQQKVGHRVQRTRLRRRLKR